MNVVCMRCRFGGVLIILRPGFEEISIAALAA